MCSSSSAAEQPARSRRTRATSARNARSSNFDIRHRLTLSYLWELPFGKGRAMLNRGGISNFVLGGWQTNGILTIQTGLPFSPVLQTSTTNTGTGSRPDVVGAVSYPQTLTTLVRPERPSPIRPPTPTATPVATSWLDPAAGIGICRSSKTSPSANG